MGITIFFSVTGGPLHMNKFPSEIIKSDKFSLHSSTLQQLAPLSSTSYITAAFVLASGHPGLEINTVH